jgi:hypothetical protein
VAAAVSLEKVSVGVVGKSLFNCSDVQTCVTVD